jgi:predicted Zn-dependent protease with MMP-like domain
MAVKIAFDARVYPKTFEVSKTSEVCALQDPEVNQRTRDRFDRQLEQVLANMPPLVHELMEKIPLHVEDYPSQDVMEDKDISDPEELCGLFTGVAITEKSIEHSGTLPDVVTIYRLGIMAAARDRHGRITAAALREQIRITLLHELAHFHGLDEDELEELGYG